MAKEERIDDFFQDKEMFAFVVELTPTYLLCGVRDAATIRNNLTDGKDLYRKLPPGPSAFACCTLLNNLDLWTLRSENEHDRDHDCHRTKGGIYTSKTAGGGGERRTFMCGWDKIGMSAHTTLMSFFSKMRQHDGFEDLLSASDDWIADNKPEKKTRTKRQRDSGCEEDDEEPTFLEFTEMMGV